MLVASITLNAVCRGSLTFCSLRFLIAVALIHAAEQILHFAVHVPALLSQIREVCHEFCITPRFEHK